MSGKKVKEARRQSKETEMEMLRSLVMIQLRSALNEPSDYMVGLYNGLEVALASLENREAKLLNCIPKKEDEANEKA